MTLTKEDLMSVNKITLDLTTQNPTNRIPSSFTVVFTAVPELPQIRQVIEHNRTISVVWKDSKTNHATCDSNDTFDPKIGLAICILKRIYTGKKGKEELAKIISGRSFSPPKKLKVKKIAKETVKKTKTLRSRAIALLPKSTIKKLQSNKKGDK